MRSRSCVAQVPKTSQKSPLLHAVLAVARLHVELETLTQIITNVPAILIDVDFSGIDG